ncbi:MAG: AAA family ATPase [Chloroflexi bacterium]|nr:AAA family ATPase [Chloroflexota bacterium]MCY3588145.1 AAA family ATPase [Chloroflexota bacterium]MCY3686987.1 AAA family ATPase [Chloroflexota bacterium]MDE2707943.1 AAA family ATPase [Chloroflexota bacterium]MXV81571.1 AAA domain-containing protein [Chloroflexota bacterium]
MTDLSAVSKDAITPSHSDDLDALLSTLPGAIRRAIEEHGQAHGLLEIVLDLGRPPYARYVDGEVILRQTEVTNAELQLVVAGLGEFGTDNRAGIPRTLHRIACIRNRQRGVVGLTMRVGRAVTGSVAVIEDFVKAGASILLLGRPGVGKTTILREAARVLAEQGKRVVIVDTSNEIGGDGDIPHSGIGRARRMQVERPELQHSVMVEAVENHMPEVIVIDEIGTELEAQAARTIAERGVQLVATAHGNELANLMLNPTLVDLIGGIQTVTLSDEEARRRGTRKSVLERKAPPTFEALVEIQSFTRVAVHSDLDNTVDALLRGESVAAEIREVDDDGTVHTSTDSVESVVAEGGLSGFETSLNELFERRSSSSLGSGASFGNGSSHEAPLRRRMGSRPRHAAPGPHQKVYPLGVSLSRLREAIRETGANVSIAERIEEADVVITLRASFRRRPPELRLAESRRMPVVVLKHNTVLQMEKSLRALSKGASPNDTVTAALSEAEEAISQIHSGRQSSIDLAPQGPYIRKLQHQLASDQALESVSRGREPNRRVRIHAG